jgi:uncharacterized protein
MKPLIAEKWAENRSYLMAIDLFNHGYYWESHEEWERLFRVSVPDSPTGQFLKGLVKLSAAGMKVREYSIHGVRRHAASAGEVFAEVAAITEQEVFCGLGIHGTPVRRRPSRPAHATKTTIPSASRSRSFPSRCSPIRCRWDEPALINVAVTGAAGSV